MRRMKSESVKSTVTSYLKRRHYSDVEPFCKSESIQRCHTRQQMAVMAAVDKEATRNSSITYTNICNDTVLVDQQFSRLKTWVAESYRHELASLLCPMFCHLYLEMLSGNHRQSANKFFKRHQGLFASREHSRELLEELASITSSQDIETNSLVKAFRSSKYHLKLSPQGMVFLQKYLSDHGHNLLLQMMHTWFDIEISGTTKQEKDEEDVVTAIPDSGNHEKMLSQEEQKLKSPVADRGSDCDAALDALKVATQLVLEKPTPPSPLLLYKVMNAADNVYCGCTNESVSHLAAGVDSSVRLWGLTPSVVGECLDSNTSVIFRGHNGAVQDVMFLPRSRAPGILISVSQDGTMRIWKLNDSEHSYVYRGHDQCIWSVDASSLGIYIATGARDKTARLWVTDRSFPLRTFAGHIEDVESVKFHPNNMYIATGSTDKTVRMWALNDSKLLRLFTGHRGAVQALAFSPNGKYLASSGEDKRVKVWDLAAGGMFKEYKGHTLPVIGLSWSRNNEHLASCSLDGTVRLWDIHPRTSTSSEDRMPDDLLRMYTIGGSAVLSVQHSRSNTVVCVGVH